MKKIAIIGRGTAGSIATAHLLRWTDCDVEWYFDSNIKPQAVGEGTTLGVPQILYENIGFVYDDLEKIDGTIKLGIKKVNWGKEGKTFYHNFNPTGHTSFHFNANKLQDYILSEVSKNPRLKIIDANIQSHDDIDAEFIMDCSGKPKSYEDCYISEYVTVNAVHVNQCYWDYPRFQHTIAHCAPFGWVFLIPLMNRCSVGYLYNHNYNTLDEIKEDIKKIFDEYNLTPSEHTNSFQFENYFRKNNFEGRVAYNGNASFFLEPMEATSIYCIENISRFAIDMINFQLTEEYCNNEYLNMMNKIEHAVGIHYYPGSIYKTDFWEFAKNRGENCIKNFMSPDFINLIKMIESEKDIKNHYYIPGKSANEYRPRFGHWVSYYSWKTHIQELGILDDLLKLT